MAANREVHVCRELGHMAKAMPMLHPSLEESRWGLPRQTASNLLSALGTVLLLISPPQANGRKQVSISKGTRIQSARLARERNRELCFTLNLVSSDLPLPI